MAGKLVPTPQQFFDNNGDPLSFGRVWTYELGTSTLAETYSDVDISIANTNPIILDIAGRCEMYADRAVSVKVRDDQGNLLSFYDQPEVPFNWGAITDKPNSLSGYGIPSVDWSVVENTPTTLAGYNISDIDWGIISSTPTTLAGYGITDAFDPGHIGKTIIAGNDTTQDQGPSELLYSPTDFTFVEGDTVDSFYTAGTSEEFYISAGLYRLDLTVIARGPAPTETSFVDYTCSGRCFVGSSTPATVDGSQTVFTDEFTHYVTLYSCTLHKVTAASNAVKLSTNWSSSNHAAGKIYDTRLVLQRIGDV